MRDTLHELLTYTGYNVITARSPIEALEMMDHKKIAPDVILSDIMMAEMDGYKFLDVLRKNEAYNHIPFIFMSGKYDPEPPLNGADRTHFVNKPFEVAELLQTIDSALMPAPMSTKISITFEIEGHETDSAALANLLKDEMLVESMLRMADVLKHEAEIGSCPVHHQLPEAVISLSSAHGLQTRIRGCCAKVVKSTTRLLTDTLRDTAPFYPYMALKLYVGDDPKPLIFDTNAIDHWVIGRSDAKKTNAPDIDLAAYGATEAGISRSHAVLMWWHGTLHISDNGSANGTYLNGQRLEKDRPYMLRHGDRLQLANLGMEIAFERPAVDAG
jgi:CheY-like chemotaxis protein